MKGEQLKEQGTLPKMNKIKIMWTTGITQDYLKRLSNSMPWRIQQVMATKGDPPRTEDPLNM
jgi:hypothetical protein